jgi:hypothetical protein
LSQIQEPTSSNLKPTAYSKSEAEEYDQSEAIDDAAQLKDQHQPNQCITAFASGTGLAGNLLSIP